MAYQLRHPSFDLHFFLLSFYLLAQYTFVSFNFMTVTSITRERTWRFRKQRLGMLAFVILSCATASYADPRALNFITTVGPDGPWNALVQTVSWPEQNVTMFPAFTTSNLFVQQTACGDQDSACPLPQPDMWTGSLGAWSWMNSTPFEASSWDSSLEPLSLKGQGTYISDRIELQAPGQSTSYLDFVANAIDRDFTVNYPASTKWYTMNTGFFSLNGAAETVNWTSVNGSSIALNRTLPLAYENGAIPSISYSLHIGSGSTEAPIPGSLVLSGYDRSRCLTDPIVSHGDTFELIDIGLGVAEGASPFPEAQTLPVDGLLRLNGSAVERLTAYPNPGVPYLNLPSDTCSAIAAKLPVGLDSDLGLYLWNTSDPAFEHITSSPSYLSFTFSSDGEEANSTIYVPFALLNLTLDYPLVTAPTQYFPCSPYTPSDGKTFHLGRAFLQAAFIAQNWQSQTMMLAQAPGPATGSQDIKVMTESDTTLSARINAPLWNATWSSTLTALPQPSSGAATTKDQSRGLSKGVIAGVVVGALLVVGAIVGSFFYYQFRQKKSAAAAGKWDEPSIGADVSLPYECNVKHEVNTTETQTMAEMSAITKGTMLWPAEVSGQAYVAEIDGTTCVSEKYGQAIQKGK